MRKIKRFSTVILCVIVFCLGASSCWFWGGFNRLMYDYFQEESHYREWTMTVGDFIWIDWDNERVTYSLFKDSEEYEYKALEKKKGDFIYLNLYVSETDKEYWGETYEGVSFNLLYDNAQTIIQNGGLERIKIGDTVTVKATDWTYSDTRFLYIAALESDSVCYLDFETGLKNITKYMDENRSLL